MTLEAGGRLANSLAAFFLERGDLFMMLTYLSVGLAVVAKEHEKRMDDIKEKEQV